MDNRNLSGNTVKAKKHLGQHFLTDLNIAAKIAGAVTGGTPEQPAAVLEVGSGTGVLTRFLLERPYIVLYGAEVDPESISYLRDHYPEFASGRLYQSDFLQMDLKGQFAGYPSLGIVGNFPYNISSQIFFKVVENRDFIPEVVGMVQKEVAQRIAEPPGSRLYGITSVILQAWYDIEYLFTVNENVFNPPPKVKSAVIRLRRNDTVILGCNEELFVKVVKAAFGQRRKMVRNALRSVFGNFGGQEHRFFNERAEQLGVEEFVDLTNWVESAVKV
ncbi:MAG: 16S rRNA (adenine(1518)-N(6)/adenine(1519)-N(6))-dimethyltransferase RsmA [Alistipes sp.]|nr:16S rRNA (adenine(1518)-N(6)/adenine(1519)-N(6))-dimethyltransferase RsmA [Alistipes sp.]